MNKFVLFFIIIPPLVLGLIFFTSSAQRSGDGFLSYEQALQKGALEAGWLLSEFPKSIYNISNTVGESRSFCTHFQYPESDKIALLQSAGWMKIEPIADLRIPCETPTAEAYQLYQDQVGRLLFLHGEMNIGVLVAE